MAHRESRGRIEFDDLTTDAFEVFVERTLEESEFVEVEDGVIYETYSDARESL